MIIILVILNLVNFIISVLGLAIPSIQSIAIFSNIICLLIILFMLIRKKYQLNVLISIQLIANVAIIIINLMQIKNFEYENFILSLTYGFISLCVIEMVYAFQKYHGKKTTLRVVFILLVISILLSYGIGYLSYDAATSPLTQAKPIIYLYPQTDIEVNVKVLYLEKLTHTYPKYIIEGWDVLAKPNGDLTDLKTKRNLYALYYEAASTEKLDTSEGFVVKGADTIDFLQDKLSKVGLNEREAEEFIIYWLPKMEGNKYNFVHFLTTDDLDKIMPLEVTPKPDTSIRILMQFEPLDKPIEVKEQTIVTPERTGFVLVEWGGTMYEK